MPRKRRDPGGYGGAHPNRVDLTAQPAAPSPRQFDPALRPGVIPWNWTPAERAAAAAPAAQAHEQAIAAANEFQFDPVGIAEPSRRPDEPVTAGLPGVGPRVTPVGQLLELYRRFPNAGLAEIVEEAMQGG